MVTRLMILLITLIATIIGITLGILISDFIPFDPVWSGILLPLLILLIITKE